MRILERRFLRGPSVHGMTPCVVVTLDLEGFIPVAMEEVQGTTVVWQTLFRGESAPVKLKAADVARLVARLVFMMQAWAGSPATLVDAVTRTPALPQRHRLICGYHCEAVAEEALGLSVQLVSALLRHEAVDLEGSLCKLRALAVAGASGTLAKAVSGPWGDRRARVPVIAVTGTNGKTTTTQLIAHVLRACGKRTGATTTQGIFIDGQCVQTGDCSGYGSARKVLGDGTVQVAVLETARGGILKRGLAFESCEVGVVLNISSDHLGLDGIETLHDLAHVKGLVARCAQGAAVLNADDDLCVAMRETLAPGCRPVFFTMNPVNHVFREHLKAGGAGACLDNGWIVWCCDGTRSRVVEAAKLPFTWQGHAGYNIANALAAFAAVRCMGYKTSTIAASLVRFVSDAQSNPMRGNQFAVDGVKLIVDYAHNVVAYRAVCGTARSMLEGRARLLGVVTSPGDRRSEDLFETGHVCGSGFDELVVYEHDPRGRAAGATIHELLRGARSAAPAKPMHGEPRIRQALWRGLMAACPGDVLVFTCAGTFDDLVEGVRLKSPAAAERIARELSP